MNWVPICVEGILSRPHATYNRDYFWNLKKCVDISKDSHFHLDV